jgi:epoxyqueuosine reductase
MPGAKSVISVALNYYPEQRLSSGQCQFAYYAYGKDYHDVVRAKLISLAAKIKELLGEETECKVCCDTVPILDRYWAWKSGLGWIGKNTNLIIPQAGSFFFLGEIVLTEELEYDTPMESRCGACTRCLDSCPTKALAEACCLDSRRCLSYLTIENRAEIPEELAASLPPYIYGCDRCQLACPHNSFARPTKVKEFAPTAEFMAMRPTDWSALSVEKYRTLFKGSAVKRAKYEGLLRNISHLSGLDKQDAPLS